VVVLFLLGGGRSRGCGARFGSVSARASKYNWLNEGGEIFQAASSTRRTVAVRRRKWNLRQSAETC
jgi:hypothetical protein